MNSKEFYVPTRARHDLDLHQLRRHAREQEQQAHAL